MIQVFRSVGTKIIAVVFIIIMMIFVLTSVDWSALGRESAVGGTSAVAPLWAALIALCNEQLGKNLGWFHPVLYSTLAGTDAFREITVGNNGAFRASKGWDCCTGLGTPNGLAILNALKKQTQQ